MLVFDNLIMVIRISFIFFKIDNSWITIAKTIQTKIYHICHFSATADQILHLFPGIQKGVKTSRLIVSLNYKMWVFTLLAGGVKWRTDVVMPWESPCSRHSNRNNVYRSRTPALMARGSQPPDSSLHTVN